ncbi:hypothetical protein ACVWXP_007195 [Bradyrhizobium sp. USDA 4463]
MSGGKGHRLRMEIAPGDDLAGLDQNQRIVGDGIGLDDQRARSLRDQIQRGPRDLRLAAQAIGILHALVAFEMRQPDVAAIEQRGQRRGRGDLAGMTAQRLDLGTERRGRGHRGIDRQRTGDERRAGEAKCAQHA